MANTALSTTHQPPINIAPLTEEQCELCDAMSFSIDIVDGKKVCYPCRYTRNCAVCCREIIHFGEKYFCKVCYATIEITKITDELYLSNAYAASDTTRLKAIGIKQILTVGRELKPNIDPDFKTMYIPIDDVYSACIMTHFDSAIEFIKQGRTLVHCYAGVSRSATIVAAYLISEKSMSVVDAIDYIRARRPVINPNSGFMEQLRIFEAGLKLLADVGGKPLESKLESKPSESKLESKAKIIERRKPIRFDMMFEMDTDDTIQSLDNLIYEVDEKPNDLPGYIPEK